MMSVSDAPVHWKKVVTWDVRGMLAGEEEYVQNIAENAKLTQTRQANLVRKLRELWIAKHRRVPHELVANVWFRRVQRHGVMPYVLRGKERFERQPVQKIPGAE